jgi:predicted ribosome quality control (RQC) complex YloA/Tae2 family protein
VDIETLAKMRAMERAYVSGNPQLMDLVADGTVKVEGDLKLKRVQFDTSYALSEKLDEIAGLLEVSRREFLEKALCDALAKAEAAFLATYEEVAHEPFGEVA